MFSEFDTRHLHTGETFSYFLKVKRTVCWKPIHYTIHTQTLYYVILLYKQVNHNVIEEYIFYRQTFLFSMICSKNKTYVTSLRLYLKKYLLVSHSTNHKNLNINSLKQAYFSFYIQVYYISNMILSQTSYDSKYKMTIQVQLEYYF